MTKNEQKKVNELLAAVRQVASECEQFFKDFSLLTAKCWGEDLRNAIREFNKKK